MMLPSVTDALLACSLERRACYGPSIWRAPVAEATAPSRACVRRSPGSVASPNFRTTGPAAQVFPVQGTGHLDARAAI
jgi:hypothetical protein